MAKNKATSAGILAGVLFSILLIFGCSELPNQPISGPQIGDFAAISADPGRPVVSEIMGFAESPVEAQEGGSLNVPIQPGASATFEVPPNSISQDVTISISVRQIMVSGKAILDFRFEPSGLVFKPDALLTIDAAAFNDPDMKYVEWYYYNPQKRALELDHTAKVVRGKVVIPISHFSRYVGISQGGQQ